MSSEPAAKKSTTTLEKLHQKYYGHPDEYIATPRFPEPQHDGIVKSQVRLSFKCPAPVNTRLGHMHMHTFQKSSDNDAFTNFKITPSSAVIGIDLVMGGWLVERLCLYKHLNKEIEFSLMKGGRAIRAMQFHETSVIFTATADVTISYDIVTPLEKPDDMTEAVFYQENTDSNTMCEQYSGNRIDLPYYLPMVKLYAFLPEYIDSARIILDGVDHDLLMTKEEDGLGRRYVFDFGDETAVNIGLVKQAYIMVSKTDPTNVKFAGRTVIITKNVLRQGFPGMSEVVFAC